jgi:hypothetical protein
LRTLLTFCVLPGVLRSRRLVMMVMDEASTWPYSGAPEQMVGRTPYRLKWTIFVYSITYLLEGFRFEGMGEWDPTPLIPKPLNPKNFSFFKDLKCLRRC